ncbi:alpha/beta hydrolase [Microbulbifer guangxiensis]|uniref:alpha/beta hydrolase n=1 Tax=Microbulbifer guangxiensis TaxID=2904249 RepID=UPI001F48C49D|nr:alpha/beta hydrolase [Microbulbifer guangxiensis]
MQKARQLDPALAQWLETINEVVAKLKAAGFEPTPTNARESLANLTRGFVEAGPEMPAVDTTVPGPRYAVPVRIYRPEENDGGPAIIYAHGGGHMAGSVSVYDPICRRIAQHCKRTVISVDYRLAPENPYPAGLEDLLTVVRGIGPALDRKGIEHGDRWILMGDSGGGALCASASTLLQHERHNIVAQVLVYPSLDYTMQLPSIDENGRGYLLEKEKIGWYFNNYFQGVENRRACSPLYAEFTANLPRTLMVTAEFCPLRDEGFAYVDKLKEAGVAAELLHFDQQIHAFLNLESMVAADCERFYRHTAEFVRGLTD